MGAFTVATNAALGLVAVVLIWWFLAALRWRTLCRTAGSFPCSLLDHTAAKRPQRHGVARFSNSALRWYARGSLSWRPVYRWPRVGLEVVGANQDNEDSDSLWETVRLVSGGHSYLMVLSRSASAGLVGWIEAGPFHQHPASGNRLM